ncbi:MAG: hypothetical protein K2Y71_05380, partial [Xanthobacteraceae bacterium]|nr:hypothetical protein [Xanthobacteraceae bacterium]
MVDDFDDLLTAEAVPGVPPALELEEALLLPVDVEIEVGIFLPDDIGADRNGRPAIACRANP